MTTFTASEVRELANDFAGYSATHHAIGHGLLDVAYAYADRLEADEKGKPVADYDPRASFTVPIDTTTLQRNATHPAPADAAMAEESGNE